MAFFDNKRRKRRYRAHVSSLEKGIGYVAMLLIAGIALAIYAKGRRFDPGLFALDPTALEAGAPAVAPTVAHPATAPLLASQETPVAVPFDLPIGWRAMGAVERFNPENLYIKIDGRAEAFLSYSFVELVAATLVSDDHPDAFVDVFIYDMGSSLNAFGIFAAERSKGDPADYGDEAYASEGSLFFRTGQYYVQVLSSDASDAVAAAAQKVASAIDASRASETDRPWAFDVFPTDRLVPDSIGYVKENALGFSFLSDVYTATYATQSGKVVCFLTRAESPDAARQLFDRYRAYVEKYGSVVATSEDTTGPRFTGDVGGTFDSVFCAGDTLGGATSAPDVATAEDLVQALKEAL